MVEDPVPPPGIDPRQPSIGRIYDYLLGGKDNYTADREAAEMYLAVDPDVAVTARANRTFGKRAVRYIAEHGIRQIIDLGSGIPTTPPSVHETARIVDPSVRVVYVDRDPVVVAHSMALRSVNPGLDTILADIQEPETVLDHPSLRALIDLDEPVGVVIFSVLDAIEDQNDPEGIVERYTRRMVPGSYLGISHLSARSDPAAVARVHQVGEEAGVPPLLFRTDDEVLRYFEGFDVVEPGLVDVTAWRPEQDYPRLRITLVGAVGRKPS